jgi:hypothetical protein
MFVLQSRILAGMLIPTGDIGLRKHVGLHGIAKLPGRRFDPDCRDLIGTGHDRKVYREQQQTNLRCETASAQG